MSDDLIENADAFLAHMAHEMQDICDYCQREKALELVPKLVAEIKRLEQLISRTASNFLQLQPGIVWEGGIDEAMKATVEKIKQLREERYAILGVKTTEGLTASEWVLRTGLAERQLVAKDTEIAKWKQIAIKQHALIKFIETEERYAYSEHVILSDRELEQAAKELGIQIIQEDEDLTTAYMLGSQKADERLKVLQGYVKRLEKEYIDATRLELYLRKYSKRGDIMLSDAYDLADKEAQAALEKIRHET